MVDRASRRTTSELLRHLVSGQITNVDFESRMPKKSSDPAIWEMFQVGWSLYGDQRTYRLSGRDRVNPNDRHVVARCILFLQTELEYEWPVLPRSRAVLLLVASLLTGGWANRVANRKYARHGNFAVWPFIREADHAAALANPTYLGKAV